MSSDIPFWERKTLNQMDKQEWESLCDGCGYCCLIKLEDEEDGHVYTTNVACRLLDTESCRCQDYPNRQTLVDTCLVLNVDAPEPFSLLPDTCAYRRLFEGKPLPAWHPLISKDTLTVSQAGISVCEYAISEDYVHPEQLQDHVIHRLR